MSKAPWKFLKIVHYYKVVPETLRLSKSHEREGITSRKANGLESSPSSPSSTYRSTVRKRVSRSHSNWTTPPLWTPSFDISPTILCLCTLVLPCSRFTINVLYIFFSPLSAIREETRGESPYFMSKKAIAMGKIIFSGKTMNKNATNFQSMIFWYEKY